MLKNQIDENYYSKLEIDIQDNGIGISQENIKNLFIDFEKLKDEH